MELAFENVEELRVIHVSWEWVPLSRRREGKGANTGSFDAKVTNISRSLYALEGRYVIVRTLNIILFWSGSQWRFTFALLEQVKDWLWWQGNDKSTVELNLYKIITQIFDQRKRSISLPTKFSPEQYSLLSQVIKHYWKIDQHINKLKKT